MRTRIILSITLLAALPLGDTRVYAHHSNVAFAVETVLTATGTVKEWQWSNPHTWLIMDVDDGKGGKVEWAMEGRAPGVPAARRVVEKRAEAWRQGDRALQSVEGR